MGTRAAGFDSILFERRGIETPEKVFKAFMSAGVTTEDEESFRLRYNEALDEVFQQKEIRRKKLVYKGYHFRLQTKDNTSEMICLLLEKMVDLISRIDLFCGYYDLPYISIYGDASGQKIKRMTFLEKNQNSFHHVCAWKYMKDYGSDCRLQLDHFSGAKTPAWEELVASRPNMEVYFSGCECNPLISVADLVLTLIKTHQYGTISSSTLFNSIKKRCPSFRGSRKFAYHDMKKFLKMTTPIVPLRMDLSHFIKHPIFFIVWNPEAPRKRVKPMFEWSPLYNSVVKKVLEERGCFKFISPEEDHVFWDCEKDKLVAWSDVDEMMIGWMEKMDFELPTVLKKEDLVE